MRSLRVPGTEALHRVAEEGVHERAHRTAVGQRIEADQGVADVGGPPVGQPHVLGPRADPAEQLCGLGGQRGSVAVERHHHRIVGEAPAPNVGGEVIGLGIG